jgi:hypothetical protein
MDLGVRLIGIDGRGIRERQRSENEPAGLDGRELSVGRGRIVGISGGDVKSAGEKACGCDVVLLRLSTSALTSTLT